MNKIFLIPKKEKSPADNGRTALRAQVMCSGTCDLAAKKYIYDGVESDCYSMTYLAGGDKMCTYGCIGQGSCVKICPNNAIRIVNGIAAIEYEKCTACGKCVEICPKKVIKLLPRQTRYWVGCLSKSESDITKNGCDVGCTGCRICEDVCETGAIKVEENLAKIDDSLCIGCGRCADECRRNIIWHS